MKNHVTIVIPAYNPDHNTLMTLITELLKLDSDKLIEKIVVIDDGSDNDFSKIFADLANLPCLTLLRHVINLGKGAALKTGFNHILLDHPETGSIVTADADGQHHPVDILNVARAALDHNLTTLTLGVRSFSRQTPLRSLFGNQITRLIVKFFTGLRLADTQTGLRAWPPGLARQALKIPINGYDFEMECLIRYKELGGQHLAINEVPIRTIYHGGNKCSHFNPLFDSLRIYFVFIRYCGAGIVTALTDNFFFILVYMISGSVIGSQIISRSIGALVSFILGFHLVFHSKTNKGYALLKFISLVLLFGFISYGLIQFFCQLWSIHVVFAKILAELILFVASFAIQRDFIFNRKD